MSFAGFCFGRRRKELTLAYLDSFGVDNLPAVERIWAATDEAGYPLDWREVLRKEGVSMMLM